MATIPVDDRMKFVEQMLLELGRQNGFYETFIVDTVLLDQRILESGDEVTVLVFYPKWRGLYGQMSAAVYYLNNDRDRKRFEYYAQVQIADLKVYKGRNNQPQRKPGETYEWENPVCPFEILVGAQPETQGTKAQKKPILSWRKLPWEIERWRKRQVAQKGPQGAQGAEVHPSTPPPPESPPDEAAGKVGGQSAPMTAEQEEASFGIMLAKELKTITKPADVDAARKYLCPGPWDFKFIGAYQDVIRKFDQTRHEALQQGVDEKEANARAKKVAQDAWLQHQIPF